MGDGKGSDIDAFFARMKAAPKPAVVSGGEEAERKPKPPTAVVRPQAPKEETETVDAEPAPTLAKALPVRTGRPPGRRDKPQRPKAQMTIWSDADLLNKYRDWSWDAKKMLGELITEALTDYYERHRRGK